QTGDDNDRRPDQAHGEPLSRLEAAGELQPGCRDQLQADVQRPPADANEARAVWHQPLGCHTGRRDGALHARRAAALTLTCRKENDGSFYLPARLFTPPMNETRRARSSCEARSAEIRSSCRATCTSASVMFLTVPCTAASVVSTLATRAANS